ncbi:MAG: hypothetical protein GX594_15525 [Pirellulaceae bacterium]|nr:hypothetical protein [Pirellulaceae bacterium]
MKTISQTVTLTSKDHYGRRVPPKAFGELLTVIPDAVRFSIRMAFESRSRAKGKRPGWLAAASDISQFFSAIPKPRRSRYDLRDVLREQQHKKGIAAIFGKWPGDETDQQIAEAMKELG